MATHASDELTAAVADLRAAVQMREVDERVRFRVAELEAEIHRLRMAVDQLRRRLEVEEADVTRWDGRGFLPLLWWLVGRLDDRRQAEREEMVAAAVQLASQLDLLTNTERQLVAATAELSVDVRELDEALTACEAAIDVAIHASERFEKAAGWGTWDMFGGGLIASSMKRTRVEEGLDSVQRLRVAMARTRRELDDVGPDVEVPPGLELDSGAWAFDVWFDNIFSDIRMQDRIDQAANSITHCTNSLRRLKRQLMDRRTAAADELVVQVEAVNTALGMDA